MRTAELVMPLRTDSLVAPCGSIDATTPLVELLLPAGPQSNVLRQPVRELSSIAQLGTGDNAGKHAAPAPASSHSDTDTEIWKANTEAKKTLSYIPPGRQEVYLHRKTEAPDHKPGEEDLGSASLLLKQWIAAPPYRPASALQCAQSPPRIVGTRGYWPKWSPESYPGSSHKAPTAQTGPMPLTQVVPTPPQLNRALCDQTQLSDALSALLFAPPVETKDRPVDDDVLVAPPPARHCGNSLVCAVQDLEQGFEWSSPCRSASPTVSYRSEGRSSVLASTPPIKLHMPSIQASLPRSHLPGSTASRCSSESASDSSLQPVGSATQSLREIFSSLSALVPDVLAACKDDASEAFEKLQRMQDEAEDNAFGWEPSPPPDTPEMPDWQKLDLLAAQFELPRGVIEECLARHGGDLPQAGQELHTLANDDCQQQVATDRALAEQVNNAMAAERSDLGSLHDQVIEGKRLDLSTSYSRAGGQGMSAPVSPHPSGLLARAGEPHGRSDTSSPGVTAHQSDDANAAMDWNAMMKRSYANLRRSFPGAPLTTVRTIVEISLGDSELGKQLLREEGFQEDTRAQEQIRPGRPGQPGHNMPWRSRSSSPQPQGQSYHITGNGSDRNNIYLESRGPGNQLRRKIFLLGEQCRSLKEQGRHNEACVAEIEYESLKRRLRAADEEASGIIFDLMNRDNTIYREIDLHGQHASEAVDKLHRLVQYCIGDEFQDTWFEVITGKGLNSVDNVPRVKHAVTAYLKQRGIMFASPTGNAGVVCFRVNRDQRLQPYDRSRVSW